jgi:hypothetical protein
MLDQSSGVVSTATPYKPGP